MYGYGNSGVSGALFTFFHILAHLIGYEHGHLEYHVAQCNGAMSSVHLVVTALSKVNMSNHRMTATTFRRCLFTINGNKSDVSPPI